MSRRTVPVTTKRIEDLSVFASEIIQKAAEAEGTLKMIDAVLENHETNFQSQEIWALRAATRSLRSIIEDAAEITDTIEQFEEIK